VDVAKKSKGKSKQSSSTNHILKDVTILPKLLRNYEEQTSFVGWYGTNIGSTVAEE